MDLDFFALQPARALTYPCDEIPPLHLPLLVPPWLCMGLPCSIFSAFPRPTIKSSLFARDPGGCTGTKLLISTTGLKAKFWALWTGEEWNRDFAKALGKESGHQRKGSNCCLWDLFSPTYPPPGTRHMQAWTSAPVIPQSRLSKASASSLSVDGQDWEVLLRTKISCGVVRTTLLGVPVNIPVKRVWDETRHLSFNQHLVVSDVTKCITNSTLWPTVLKPSLKCQHYFRVKKI